MTIASGRKVVTTAGTAVALGTGGGRINEVLITAEVDNTGYIVVGASNVVATVGSMVGTPLLKGESVSVSQESLSNIYLDSTVNGEGVSFICI